MTCKQIWRLKKCHVVEKRQDQTDHFDTDKTDHFDLVKDIQGLTMLQKIDHVQKKCSAKLVHVWLYVWFLSINKS